VLGLLSEDFGRGLTIVEEGVDFIDLFFRDFQLSEGASEDHSGSDKLNDIT